MLKTPEVSGTEALFLFEQVSSAASLLSSLELSDPQVYEPCIRALLGTASRFCEDQVYLFDLCLLVSDLCRRAPLKGQRARGELALPPSG